MHSCLVYFRWYTDITANVCRGTEFTFDIVIVAQNAIPLASTLPALPLFS